MRCQLVCTIFFKIVGFSNISHTVTGQSGCDDVVQSAN